MHPELLRRLEEVFGSERGREVARFLEEGRPETYVRVNTLRADLDDVMRSLEEAGVVLRETPLDYAFVVEDSPGPVGSCLEHVAGYVYVQDLASMVPAEVLGPEPPGPVIDACAAPGSKTTQLAQLMESEGVVLAVEKDKGRAGALVHNVVRMGCVNVLVHVGDARDIPVGAPFVLLDPPCSGEGTFHRDPHARSTWTPAKTERFSRVQASLLRALLERLPVGGRLAYSTCTLSPVENELVLNEVLDERFRVVPSAPGWLGKAAVPGLTEWRDRSLRGDLSNAFRIDPTVFGTDGFFVALIERVA